jgi:AbrB family looped-hinge helix DNA binding protein
MRVTEKGQVTIPKEIRDRLGIGPGSEVDFVPDRQGVRIVVADGEAVEDRRAASIRAWADNVSGILDLGGMTADEYFEWIRGPRDDLGPR